MINRAQQNWPEDLNEKQNGKCACGADMTDGVCSREACIFNVFGAPISIYTRAEAFADGVLVDMEKDFQRERVGLNIKHPIAMTAAAFAGCVGLTEAAAKADQDVSRRYWDVCFALRFAIRRVTERDISSLEFSVVCISSSVTPEEFHLKAVIGGDDNGFPCITIMLPDED